MIEHAINDLFNDIIDNEKANLDNRFFHLQFISVIYPKEVKTVLTDRNSNNYVDQYMREYMYGPSYSNV